jgi:hypothetical protein
MPEEYYHHHDDETTTTITTDVGDSISGLMLLVSFEVFMLMALHFLGFRFTSS